MIVNGVADADLAALTGGNTLKIYRFKLDDELADLIVRKVSAFWEYVVTDTAPPPQTVGDLNLLYAQDNGQIKTVDASVFKLWEDYHDANTSFKAQENHLRGLKNDLRFAIAEAAGVRCDSAAFDAAGIDRPGIEYATKPLATWRTQTTNRVDVKRLKAEKPEVWKEYLKPSKSRVLRITKR